jgi:ketosteroid isomerase-like protein
MPQESVELVRQAFEAYARNGLNAVLPFVAPDAKFYPDPNWMEDTEYVGRDGFAAFDKTQRDVFGEDFAVEVREIRAVGARVLVLTEASGRATGSGVPIRQPAAHVLSDFRDGMIGEDRTFLSWDDALKAVGLEE